ncbi:phytoene/squalene synthase family protein [Acidiphilium sp.]|uniref:phytoene/squalene synthase family protein n=1 Tax=Acidiphilium sp. TaxID=527 RepID=UPI003CFF5BD6
MNDRDLADLVRRADPDRFIGAIFAPAEARRRLLALYAFNHELARAREVASTPPLALIRLHWWREVVEGAARDHPVANLLPELRARDGIVQRDLVALIDAREAECEPIADRAAFLAYARGTAGRLMAVAGRILGVQDQIALASLEDLGTGYAIASILRASDSLRATGRDLLPSDGTPRRALIEHAQDLLARDPPRAALAATLPSVLARRDLARLRRGESYHPRGLGDRIAVIAAGLRAMGGSRPLSRQMI